MLSIYGGGIRGIIPAMILVEIEKRYSAFLGKKVFIAEMFDLLCGTSTGGILSLGSAYPDTNTGRPKYSAQDLLDIYLKKGDSIFLQGAIREAMEDVADDMSGFVEHTMDFFGGIIDSI